ncbi:ABC transporter permease [Cupriavidus sp. WS]|uniref:ABC transporter permease n=1 Tax=Cupriavidus sp. WS TaxID=1312922 RepID=UPI00037D81E3|nr:ABC transporter permease subunit [Cupriavidus sp. WS]
MNPGAGRWTTLLRIVLPVSARGVLSAFLLCLLMSFSEVTVTIFMAGPGRQTLPVRIYNYLTDQVDPTVAAISSMIIFLTIALVPILDRLGGLRGSKWSFPASQRSKGDSEWPGPLILPMTAASAP